MSTLVAAALAILVFLSVQNLNGQTWTVENTSNLGTQLYASTAAATATATTATTLIGSGSGSLTLAANFWTAGKSLRVETGGHYTTPSNATTLTTNLLLGGSTVIGTGAMTTIASVSSGEWRMICTLTDRTTGTSGTIAASCSFIMSPSSLSSLTPATPPIVLTSTFTQDTTISAALDVKSTWSTTTGSPSITSDTFILSSIGTGTAVGGGGSSTVLYPLINDGTSISLQGPGPDPRKYYSMYEEFDNSATASLSIGRNNWATAGTITVSATTAGPTGDAIGILDMTSSSGGGISSGSSVLSWNPSTHTFDVLIRANLRTTTSISACWGMNASITTTETTATDLISVCYDTTQSDTNFMYVTRAASTSTRTSSGVAADTAWHTFRIRSTTAGTILFSIDGGTETSQSTNVPTANIFPVIIVKSTSGHIQTDYYFANLALSR